MAKGSDRLGSGFDLDETGGALSGFLAEEDELDSRALWRLGTWAVVSIGAVIVALVSNQSSIGMRREQNAAADLLRQTQQVQLAAKETQSEAKRLASAIDTLNSDRDRLYSRVAVLEQGLDSVTGAIARQNSTPPSSSPQARSGPTAASPATASPTAGPSATASTSTMASAPAATPPPSTAAPVASASVDPPPPTPKPPPPAPLVAPVAATAAAVADKPAAAAAASEPSPPPASIAPLKPEQPSGSLMASKSMMAPPDPGAGKLMEAAAPPKTVTSAPMPEVAALTPQPPEEAEPDSASSAPELVIKPTEFGVDIGGANSIAGLRALWRGLLKSRSNAALTTLRPIIVIKETSNGLSMQLRLVAGPIRDAAAAAKICASLSMNDRSCTTAVFEGQRLALSADEQTKAEAEPVKSENKTSLVDDSKAVRSAPKSSLRRRFAARHPPKEESPKPEPSTLSLIFGKR
jgi:hypothetical protein